MDFVSGLSRTLKDYDTIWVIVDRLTKSAYFLTLRLNYPLEKLTKMYVERIVNLHGIPSSIVSDINMRFTSRTLT